MGCGVGVAGPNHTKVIRELRRVGKEVADPQSALAVLAKLERRLHQVTDRTVVGSNDGVALVGRVVELGEGRFVVERIDLARRAVHEQKDGVLGFGFEVRRFGAEESAGGRVR